MIIACFSNECHLIAFINRILSRVRRYNYVFHSVNDPASVSESEFGVFYYCVVYLQFRIVKQHSISRLSLLLSSV